MNLQETDKEFMELFRQFADDEVAKEETAALEEKVRCMAILAALMGSQALDAFKEELKTALDAKVSPLVIKEIIYQGTPYMGYGRMLPFLMAANEVFEEKELELITIPMSTVTAETRLQKGAQVQTIIFGEHMKEAYKEGNVNRWLADNCFGDYYTRKGMDLAEREMITFCILMAQGGCEPQLKAHAKGNMNVGNDEAFLTKVVSQCLPYIGYPRSLNVLSCIREAAGN